jgi:hypothetical protein
MHEAMVGFMKSITRETALKMTADLSPRCPLGIEGGKKGSMLAQVLEFKSFHPDKVLLVRVGEMYEAFGVDAALVVDAFVGCDPKNGEARVAVHASKVQHVLDQLVIRGLTTAVYEESEVICTPRHRYMAQIVSSANPLYGIDTGSTPAPMRIAGVMAHSDGSVTVCLVDLQHGLCQRMHQVSAECAAATVLGNRIDRPIYVLRNVPSWLRYEDTVILGAAACVEISERLIQEIGVRLSVSKEHIRVIPMEKSRCAPLPVFTLQQLGLKNDLGVPSLVEFCLPRYVSPAIKRCLMDWLSAPPSERIAHCNRTIVQRLRGENVSIGLRPSNAGRVAKGVEAMTADADALRLLIYNARAISESPIDLSDLKMALCRQLSLVVDDAYCRKVIDTISSHLSDPYTLSDPRGSAFDITLCSLRTHLAVEMADYDAKKRTIEKLLEGFHEGQILKDSRGVAFRGRPDQPDRLPVYDRNHRIIPNAYTTDALRAAEGALATSACDLIQADHKCLRACLLLLQGHLPAIRTIEGLSLHVVTLVEHARASVGRSWCVPTTGDKLELRECRPYWIEHAVSNPIDMDAGDIVILTAPNGGGKTTLLRSAASCVLMHQCGLTVPCTSATIPLVDGVFLRCGSLDATLERRSSFASEMVDLRTIISTPGTVFAFVDEPCRGTSCTDGLALLQSVLENAPQALTAIVSTHYHELSVESTRVHRWQLEADVVDDDCKPRYRLSPGACSNSLALHVALAVGLPIDIVRRARRTEDVDTLLMSNFYAEDIKFERVGRLQTVGAAIHSALYVLDTIEGVYVGESDRIVQRLQTHERTKPTITSFFVARCVSKTQARRLETRLINDLKFHNVKLLSVADGAHHDA